MSICPLEPFVKTSRSPQQTGPVQTIQPRSAAPATVVRPYFEHEPVGDLFFSAPSEWKGDGVNWDAWDAPVKDLVAANLPEGVNLVVYTQSKDDIAEVRAHYANLVDPGHLDVVHLKDADVFGDSSGPWARDYLPIPVLVDAGNGEEKLGVVDAEYMKPIEPDLAVAQHLGAVLLSHERVFDGGNFLAVRINGKDTLFTEDPQVPDEIFQKLYGCEQVIDLPLAGGIGHIDERLKFIDETHVLTDTPSYVPILEKLGLEVNLVPLAGGHRTYMNSLIVNDTVFVPVFGKPVDIEAIAAYRRTGLKVIPFPGSELADDHQGSLHCLTMTYPKMDQS
jgi:hypothetical protein